MPKRKKIDKQEIFNLYQELKNATEVAKQLDIHRNTVYQHLRQLKGKCIDCSNEQKSGSVYCQKCLNRIKERTDKKRKERKRKGVCVECDNFVQPPSQTFCAEHRLKKIKRQEKYKTKIRKSISQLSPSERRIENIRKRYGKNAVKVWNKYFASCAICYRHDEDIAIHIHHINCNPKDNREENLILLCFDCHTTTHKLIDHVPNPNKLLEWIKKTYPDTF